MKFYALFFTAILITTTVVAQQTEINFVHQRTDLSTTLPRTAISPMSIKLWDNYGNGGPTTYGTVMEIYGLSSHQTSQLYFGGWDDSKIRYREAFYAQTTWSSWITLLDSKNNVESAGRLMISGTGNHFIADGNLGIGTATPSERLAVNGKIRAKEIKVEATNWPDYVFETDYPILSLAELEKYIQVNKHLPEMPTAKQVTEQGLELGELNKLLLKKVEELTLHLIAKDKELVAERERINQLELIVKEIIKKQ